MPAESEPAKSAGLGRFAAALLAIWILAWLPLGLLKGDPDYVLSAVSRGSPERQLYQGLLYGGLLLVFLDAWRRRPPVRPGWGRPGDFARYLGLGLLSAAVLRAVLVALGARAGVNLTFSLSVFGVAVASAFVVAVAEEAVFRGFLLGRLAESLGPGRAILISSAVFALVHLFRPGSAQFKAAYGVGLLLLAGLLARIAWKRNSIAASAGFHGGVILPNLVDPWPGLQPSWWSGWQAEPASGALAWALTGILWAQWEWVQREKPARP